VSECDFSSQGLRTISAKEKGIDNGKSNRKYGRPVEAVIPRKIAITIEIRIIIGQ
jgi:hypothetical protein